MGEFVSLNDIPNAELVVAGAGGSVTRVVRIPGGAGRWTLITVPIDGGVGPNPTFLIEYDVGGTFFPTNPATSGTVNRDEANIITREDVVEEIRITVTNGGTVILGDVLIRLYMSRER